MPSDTSPQQQRYPCPVCGNTFTRPQHVVRHLRSHTGERPYKCKECGDAFARSDLLSRHVNKCHPALAQSGPPLARNQPKRRACEHCAHTGSRCDNSSPCASCVEQDVLCSRMPKAIANHPPPHHPTFSDAHVSVNSSVPSMSSHRRNASDSTSDWSSDNSTRSRGSQQYSQGGMAGFGFEAGIDGLSMSRNGSLPLPWAPSSSSSSGAAGIDQSTLTPSQVRAVYGGSLPAGYAHPSQYAAGQHTAAGTTINLPHPSGSSNPLDSYNPYAPAANQAAWTGAQQQQQQKSTVGYPPKMGYANYTNDHQSNPSASSSAGLYGSSTSGGGFGGGGSGSNNSAAWKDFPSGQQQSQIPSGNHGGAPYGQPSTSSSQSHTHPHDGAGYNYDPMTDFTSHSVQGIPQAAYAVQQQHQQKDQHSSSTGNPNASSRPSLPGLDSFMSATFPSVYPSNNNPPSNGAPPAHSRYTDRRASVASTASLSDSVSTPSSLMYAPPSPSDTSMSRPGTSGTGYGPLPSALGGLQLRNANAGGSSTSSGQSPDRDGDSSAEGGSSNNNHGPGPGPGANGNGAGGDEQNATRLRQIWSSWLSTPFSSASEKDAFVLSNGVLTPVNNGSGGAPGQLSAVPSYLQHGGPASPSKAQHPSQQGQIDQYNQQQLPYALQKTMSLPAIRTPNTERRSLVGANGAIDNVQTPRVHNNGQTYNTANAEELRRYQEACLARETPSLTLAPPPLRMRNAYTPGPVADYAGGDAASNSTGTGGGSGGSEASNSPSPSSIGSGGTGGTGGSGGGGGLYVPTHSSSRPGSSQSVTSAETWNLNSNSNIAPSIPMPDSPFAKDNSSSAQYGRPSYKRLASQTLGPELAKRTAVENLSDASASDDGHGHGYSVPLRQRGGGGYDAPQPQAYSEYSDDRFSFDMHQPQPGMGPRKRSNSSPTSASTRPPNLFSNAGFPALPPYTHGNGTSGSGSGAAINSHPHAGMAQP